MRERHAYFWNYVWCPQIHENGSIDPWSRLTFQEGVPLAAGPPAPPLSYVVIPSEGSSGPEGPPTPRRNLAVWVVSNDECPTVWVTARSLGSVDPSLCCVLTVFQKIIPVARGDIQRGRSRRYPQALSFRQRGLQAPRVHRPRGGISQWRPVFFDLFPELR